MAMAKVTYFHFQLDVRDIPHECLHRNHRESYPHNIHLKQSIRRMEEYQKGLPDVRIHFLYKDCVEPVQFRQEINKR